VHEYYLGKQVNAMMFQIDNSNNLEILCVECACSVGFPRPSPVLVEWCALYVVIALQMIAAQSPRRKDQLSKIKKNLKE